MIADAPALDTAASRPSSCRVKICGLRSSAGLVAALAGGADYVGFVCYPPARRFVAAATIAALLQETESALDTVGRVGLFVNAAADEIAATMAATGLTHVQLAGDEPPALLAGLRWPVLKTIHLNAKTPPEHYLAVMATYQAAAVDLPRWPHGRRLTFVLDAAVPGQFGGTGQTTDWALAATLAARFPCALAGGLAPDNAIAAIAAVRPWLVDVSSGVETDGAKDPNKIQAFLTAARR